MSYKGNYLLETCTFINNIPNIQGTDTQRTISINGVDKVIPSGYYTLHQLNDVLDGLLKSVSATASCGYDLPTSTITYTDNSNLTLVVTNTLLQEVLGLVSPAAATSVASTYMNLAPFYYIGVKLNGFAPRYSHDNVVYQLHVTSDTAYGSVVEYKEHDELTTYGTVDGAVSFHSRGRTLTPAAFTVQLVVDESRF